MGLARGEHHPEVTASSRIRRAVLPRDVDYPAAQVPLTQPPKQQSPAFAQAAPGGEHTLPPSMQTPFWHRPPGQQSASVVQTPFPMGMQDASHEKPVGDIGSGVQMPLQHWSPRLHALPAPRHIIS